MIELNGPMKTTKTKKKIAPPPGPSIAMHSAASPDWGTPWIVRRFAQEFLRASATSGSLIDLDYSSSAYWQSHWPGGHRPNAYLDGSKGRDVLVEADRLRAMGGKTCGAGFDNPPGLDGGQMIQRSWEIFETDHRMGRMQSGVWIGFSLEQVTSLQGVSQRNPLSHDELIATIVPCRRIRYELHPKALIELLLKKQKKREKKSKQWIAEQRQIEKLRDRTSDAPVPGLAPTHASYVSVLMNEKKTIRRQQLDDARKFLASQAEDPRSPFQRYEVIGSLEMP